MVWGPAEAQNIPHHIDRTIDVSEEESTEMTRRMA